MTTENPHRPRSRKRGRCYPNLAAAFGAYLNEKSEADARPGSSKKTVEKRSVYATYKIITDDRSRYDAHSRFSIDALQRAATGLSIMPSTAKVVSKFLAFHTNYREELTKLPDTKLDLAAFFGMVDPKIISVSKLYEGCYQSYARATSILGEAAMVRRGKIKIWFDPKVFHLRIEEDQFRPRIGPFAELALRWNGFCAVRGDKLFCVMRLESNFGPVTPLFCVYNVFFSGSSKMKRVERLEGMSIGFDPENLAWPAAPIVYAERRDQQGIKVDFCDKVELKDFIRRKIFIGNEE